METVDIQPCAFFRVQQMAMAGFHQLLLAVATDIELEVAAPLVWAIIHLRVPQRRPFSLGKTYGVYMSDNGRSQRSKQAAVRRSG